MVDGLDIVKTTKNKLNTILNKHPTLFGEGLGTLNMKPVEIELKEYAKPYAGRFYSIPKAYKKMTKQSFIACILLTYYKSLAISKIVLERLCPSVR